MLLFGYLKHHAKNHLAMPSDAAKAAVFVFLMMFRNVYLITMDLTDSYWKSIDDGCQQAVGELGNVTYKWIGPDAHDDAQQSACIDDAVADGADAILIAANSADGVNGSLKKAEEAGCKIIYVDSAASYDCVTALATDNNVAGRTAAETMKKELQRVRLV